MAVALLSGVSPRVVAWYSGHGVDLGGHGRAVRGWAVVVQALRIRRPRLGISGWPRSVMRARDGVPGA